jgi:hypothetical protein
MGTYEIGKFRGHTLWMTNDKTYKNSSTDDMYVNSHDYSVWYKGRQVGYMTHDKSRIDPFNERVYKDLKALKLSMPEPAARVRENKKVKESVRGFTPLKQHLPIWIEKKYREIHEKEN